MDMAAPAWSCAVALRLNQLLQKEQTCRTQYIRTHVFDMMQVLLDTVFSVSGHWHFTTTPIWNKCPAKYTNREKIRMFDACGFRFWALHPQPSFDRAVHNAHCQQQLASR